VQNYTAFVLGPPKIAKLPDLAISNHANEAELLVPFLQNYLARVGEHRQAARLAKLNLHHRSGDEDDTLDAKATEAIQMGQTYTACWGAAGPNYHIRFRAGYAAY
jgi:hypothetical protein